MYKPSFSDQFTYTLRELHQLRSSLLPAELVRVCSDCDLDSLEVIALRKHPSNIGMSRSTHQQAAILFYELCKRKGHTKKTRLTAFLSVMLFLATHNYWLQLDHQAFLRLIQWVEISPPAAMRETIAGIAKVLKQHTTSYYA